MPNAAMQENGRRQTGVNLDSEFLSKFKEAAAKEQLSACQLLERLVREYLESLREEGK